MEKKKANHPHKKEKEIALIAKKTIEDEILHKKIVLREPYRQSTNDRPEYQSIDTENKLLWRKHPQRLDAESLHQTVG